MKYVASSRVKSQVAFSSLPKVNNSLKNVIKKIKKNIMLLNSSILKFRTEIGTGNTNSLLTQNIELNSSLDILAPIVWMPLPWLYIQFGIHNLSRNVL
jgi:hypothetical protein